MTTTHLTPCTASKNAGDNREWALCSAYGLPRTTHDSKPYYCASDLEIGELKISIKASGFSLMTSALCEGLETFDEIWALYESKVHSNVFAYITEDFTCYLMNLAEFKKFVYAFGYLDRDSKKNGGKCKIRGRKETKKMREWLEAGC
jgi:hypothetical protein